MPRHVQEMWFDSYCMLLDRCQLWTVRAEVINMCQIENVRDLNQDSTTVHTSCRRCSKPLGTTVVERILL